MSSFCNLLFFNALEPKFASLNSISIVKAKHKRHTYFHDLNCKYFLIQLDICHSLFIKLLSLPVVAYSCARAAFAFINWFPADSFCVRIRKLDKKHFLVSRRNHVCLLGFVYRTRSKGQNKRRANYSVNQRLIGIRADEFFTEVFHVLRTSSNQSSRSIPRNGRLDISGGLDTCSTSRLGRFLFLYDLTRRAENCEIKQKQSSFSLIKGNVFFFLTNKTLDQFYFD